MTFKISIIIPTYNRADLVKQTVESILNQSFSNYEIIVIDDGSTDNTGKILSKYYLLLNFRYILQTNSGRSAARNHGMEQASGEYLMFLDSDDLMSPDALQILSDTARKFPESDLIAGRRQYVDENGKFLDIKVPMELDREIFAEKIYLEKISELFFCMGSYIIKKQIARQIKGFDSSLEPCEDYDFFLKCCDISRVSYVKDKVVFIRRHEDNTAESRLREATLKISRKNFELLESNNTNFYEPELLQEMKAAWQVKMANNYYFLEQNKTALKHYLKAISIKPRLLFDKFIVKQLFAVFSPKFLKEHLKRMQ